MKKVIRTIFVVVAFMAITAEARSQDNGYTSEISYKNSIGLRLGTDNGLTFKHFYKPTWAFEGNVTTGYRGLVGTGLFEKHINIAHRAGLYLFFGGGAHVGQWNHVVYYRRQTGDGYTYVYRGYEPAPSLGVDGIFGVEYKIPDAPFTIGLDVKPYLDAFFPGESGVDGAFSCRYIFK